jgi:hypothetical protein
MLPELATFASYFLEINFRLLKTGAGAGGSGLPLTLPCTHPKNAPK